MENILYIGFKGIHNASCRLVQTLPGNRYFLTNSFSGLKKDIDVLDSSCECAIIFGVDKNLKNTHSAICNKISISNYTEQ